MDTCTWPADDRPYESSSVQRKGKKANDKGPVWDYPHLEHGSVNTVALIERHGRLEWTSIVKDDTGKKLTPIRGPTKVFPDTRALPLRGTRTTVFQRAEQGAHFLRTYFPEVDIPSELIREEIHSDTRTSRRLDDFDPFARGLIATMYCYGRSTQKLNAFLMFPMGGLNTELNISPLTFSMQEGLVFRPSAKPSRIFETPIQQIVTDSFPSLNSQQKSYLAVRTFSSTILLEARAEPTGRTPSLPVGLNEFSTITRADVGDRPLIDVRLFSEAPKAILVNEYGGVYKCTFGNGKKIVQLCNPMPTSPPENVFWRLALTDNSNGCLLASDKHIRLMDFRSNRSTLDLFSATRQRDMLTCIENSQGDHLIRAASTSEVIWIDYRFPKRPLLGYKHGRQFDRSLEVQTVLSPTPLTYLTSRKNGLVTVYDVSRSDDDKLLHVNVSPYALPLLSGHDEWHSGITSFRHPLDKNNTCVSWFQLSNRGGIHRLDLDVALKNSNGSHFPGLGFEWSTDVKEMDLQATSVRPYSGPLEARRPSPVDLSPFYNYLYMASEKSGEDKVDTVYETIERMPFLWQESNAPIEHMLTTFDVAFRSGEDPVNAARADFLTNSVLNSKPGYHALMQGRVVVKPHTRQPVWHHNITPTLNRFTAEISNDPHAVVDYLGRYNLIHAGLPVESMRREAEAREQLTLDLAMSADIYTTEPFAKSLGTKYDALETMSRATEAMSLRDEPPPVQFGYLRPSSNANADSTESLSEAEPTNPLGVRLLIKEWEVGMNPHHFAYVDPYDDGVVQNRIPARRTKIAPSGEPMNKAGHNSVVTQSQRPPPIVASSSLAPPAVQTDDPRGLSLGSQTRLTDLPRIIAPTSSQGPPANTDVIPLSQDFMASTQVLPGPFGGRQLAGKSKLLKKRVGGF